MDKTSNASANANWTAPAKPVVPKLAPRKPLLRPTGWSPTPTVA